MTIPEPTETRRIYFTPERANAALPLVRAIVADIVRQWGVVCALEERLGPWFRPGGSSSSNDVYEAEMAQVEIELRQEQDKLREYLQELEKLGVELKSVQDGLCDFPCIKDGREVYLCWLLGEAEVSHWHEVDAGFAGRRPLPFSRTSETPASSR